MKTNGLSQKAYVPIAEGDSYDPFVAADESPAEFTLKAVGLGILFGIIFGAANAYLGLRAGLTISTSIPVAVMTVAVFRALQGIGIRGTILETNISQTTGSASSSLASGIIFTLPALFMWGMPPELLQMTLLAMSGGLLGILFMIPLRRFLIEREHGKLPYPEGTACAEVLVANEIGGGRARFVFYGLAGGAFFKFLTSWISVIPGDIHSKIPFLKKGQLGMDLSAALFGVGYILGPRIAAVMVGGGLLSWLIIIPAIAYWGEARTEPFYPETINLIRDMSPSQIWTRYVRYIGAGAVATAGIITLIRSIPVMVSSFRIGSQQLSERVGETDAAVQRTSNDLPLRVVGIGVLMIAAVLVLVPQVFGAVGGTGVRMAAAICVIVFAFFFVTVASRIVGLVGVTSNPTSGMTIAALLGTASIFLLFGWTDITGKVAALTVGCVVAIAASISGDTSQDLKTGFLLGATPRRQQTAELIGVLTSAVFVCLTVLALGKGFGFGSTELPAPQATLMKLVIDGVLDQNLPWALVGLGVGIALVCEILRIPSLPFAVGVYLPVSTMTPIFVGGLIRLWMERSARDETEAADRRERGVLLGSGFVGGEGLLGVGIALVAVMQSKRPDGIGTDWAGSELAAMLVGAAAFALFITWFFRKVR
ncbi:MAG: oligopeptide transporter, OPT family [Gammaproteobacteria bacterium]|nr:oligopeptide transporter, OPT family [Gammaproteobacteria bacterium]NNF50564.1 oligopeptide transporter, OPT family [Woeseiaceae bacterium]MBT8093363.1 oligopeptide transporter, OPT family [Gammaproteobacteria bacterium]MBT8104382.1 oligopeptide transporter, OPT family [Gammaproteobacteria bacterium]NNK24398.1 oligopeptide transporter, OPT family [Woeseiaceae bacterium]